MIEGRSELQQAYRDNAVAESYVRERFDSPLGSLLHRRQTAVVRAAALQHKPARVLEIAPGPARLTRDLVNDLERVLLLDASVQMLNEARRQLDSRSNGRVIGYVQADAFNLPLFTPFDLIYSFRLIRHFERDDRLRLYRQIAAVLTPGGRFIFDAVNRSVSEPIRRARPDEHRHFDALLDLQELRQEIADSGLVVESVKGVQHHYAALMKCQVYIAPRSRALAATLMEAIERTPGGEPLEWIVTVRRA